MSLPAVLASAVLLLVTAPANAQDGAISPQEIKDNWIGKTLPGANAGGAPLTLFFKADGTVDLAGAATDSGTWRVSENGYCTTWKKIRAGQERCFTAQRKGGRIEVLHPDGSLSGTLAEIK